MSRPGVMIRPNQIDSLPLFTPQQKQTYKQGLATLWTAYEAAPQGSPQRQEAELRLRNASNKIMQQLSAHRNTNANPQQQQQGQVAAAVAAAQGGQRPGQQLGQTAPTQENPQQSSQPTQQQVRPPGQFNAGQGQAVTPAQMQAQARAAQAQAAQSQAPQAAAQQGARPGTANAADPLAELNALTILPPPNVPAAQHENYRAQAQRQGREALLKRQSLIESGRAIQKQISTSVPGDAQDKLNLSLEAVKRELQKADQQWKATKATIETNNAKALQAQGQAPGATAMGMNATSGVNAAQNINRPVTQPGMQQPQQGLKVEAGDQRPATSPAQPGVNGFQQKAQNQARPNAVTAQAMQANQLAAQQQAQQANNIGFPQNMQQQQQPPRPPPLNTQQSAGQIGQQQIPRQIGGGGPQSAQPPQALTHQAAINQAAESYSRQQQQQQQQQQAAAQQQFQQQQQQQQQNAQQPQQQQTPNGGPFNPQLPNANAAQQQQHPQHPQQNQQQPQPGQQQQPQSANTPTSAFPNLQRTPQPHVANKAFTISPHLTLDPRTQQPVAGPPPRPTLANQGMMYNPGVQRQPTYTLEGEGDRVLSKRKLDELVRQVTGAAPSSTSSSAATNPAASNSTDATTNGAAANPTDPSTTAAVLSPDVEESIMQVADNFVDDVIAAACRLAKLRPNQTLDIRDIQIVLERNYGIRIPGYSLDEVRTVRKFQPAPGWQSKMQAVQAGKVMGKRED